MSDKLLQIPAIMSRGSTMAHRTLRLWFDSDENLTDEAMGKAMSWQDKRGWLTFSVDKIAAETMLALPPLDADERKTPSQRLRGCLFRLYEQRGKDGDFEIFYRAQMERIIDAVKNKLT